MELEKIRQEIDAVDDKIAKLFGERMNLVKEVISAKKQEGKAKSLHSCFFY